MWIYELRFNGAYINFESLDTTFDTFIIEEKEFKVERKNATGIYITMSKNLSENDRDLFIGLEAGDYFDHIRVT